MPARSSPGPVLLDSMEVYGPARRQTDSRLSGPEFSNDSFVNPADERIKGVPGCGRSTAIVPLESDGNSCIVKEEGDRVSGSPFRYWLLPVEPDSNRDRADSR